MNKLKAIICMAVLTFGLQFCAAQSSTVLLRTNLDGSVSEGSIGELVEAIKEGAEIRVGWKLDLNDDGNPDLEHWIPANFLSVMNGHVFNQIEPIYRQMPNYDVPQMAIIKSEMQWTGIIGTNGKLMSRFIIPNILDFPDVTVRAQLLEQTLIQEKMVWTTWAVVDSGGKKKRKRR